VPPTRGRACVPKFGPVVVIVSETAVVPVPAAIEAGLNPQFVNAGRFEHANVTVEVNAPPPTGAAANVKLARCPASTVAEALPVFVHVKSAATVTVSPNVRVLAAGAPAAIAEIVTIVGPPNGVPDAAVTLNVTVTGDEAVGLTELEGENTQAAPVGSPAEQLSVIVPEKLPNAVTWKVLVPDVPPCPTLNEFGLGAVKLKSTTCSVTVASRVIVYGGVPGPTACAMKL
jgi:hypothetical protein